MAVDRFTKTNPHVCKAEKWKSHLVFLCAVLNVAEFVVFLSRRRTRFTVETVLKDEYESIEQVLVSYEALFR